MNDDRAVQRLKWRSRRGLLELDIVFERFWADTGGQMSERDLQALERLLSLPDNDLLDLVMGRGESADSDVQELVGRLRAA